jgi:hypothetical protein
MPGLEVRSEQLAIDCEVDVRRRRGPMCRPRVGWFNALQCRPRDERVGEVSASVRQEQWHILRIIRRCVLVVSAYTARARARLAACHRPRAGSPSATQSDSGDGDQPTARAARFGGPAMCVALGSASSWVIARPTSCMCKRMCSGRVA